MERAYFYLMFALRRACGWKSPKEFGEWKAQVLLMWCEATPISIIIYAGLGQFATQSPWFADPKILGPAVALPILLINDRVLSTKTDKWRAYEKTFRALPANRRRAADFAVALLVAATLFSPAFVFS